MKKKIIAAVLAAAVVLVLLFAVILPAVEKSGKEEKQMKVQLDKACMSFYGDWIGRPYDNLYPFTGLEEQENQVKLVFSTRASTDFSKLKDEVRQFFEEHPDALTPDMEIVVDNPRDVRSTEKEFAIGHADKVSVYQNGTLYRVYEETENGILKTEGDRTETIEVKEPYAAFWFGSW